MVPPLLHPTGRQRDVRGLCAPAAQRGGRAAGRHVVEGLSTSVCRTRLYRTRSRLAGGEGTSLEVHACTQAPHHGPRGAGRRSWAARGPCASCRRVSAAASAPSWTCRCSPIWRWRRWKTGQAVAAWPTRAGNRWPRPRNATRRDHRAEGAVRRAPAGMTFAGSSTPAPMPAGGRRWPTGCRSMPRVPTVAELPRAGAGIHTHCPLGCVSRASACRNRRWRRKACSTCWPTGWAIDRLEFRILNALDERVPTVCGQVFASASASRPAWRRCARPGQSPRAGARRSTGPGHAPDAAWAWRRAGTAAATPRCPTPRPSRRAFRAMARWCCIRARWISARDRTR
jgi:hypothetical protein